MRSRSFPIKFSRRNDTKQVYASNQFSALGAGQYITDLKFRVATDINGAYSHTDPSFSVSLGTTTMAPDGLSSTYASNITSPEQVVYSGAYSISGTTSSAQPTAV